MDKSEELVSSIVDDRASGEGKKEGGKEGKEGREQKERKVRKEGIKGGRKEGRRLLVGMGFLFGDYKVLELVVMIIQCHQGTK